MSGGISFIRLECSGHYCNVLSKASEKHRLRFFNINKINHNNEIEGLNSLSSSNGTGV